MPSPVHPILKNHRQVIVHNKLIQYVYKSLTNIGLPLPHYQNHNQNIFNIWKLVTFYVLLLTVDISTCMVSVTNYHDFNIFLAPAPFTAAATTSLGSMHVIYYYKKCIDEMLHQLATNIYQYPDEHLIQRINHSKQKWFLQEDAILMIARTSKYGQWIFLIAICVPIFVELMYYRRIKTFIYPCWTPWQLDTLTAELSTIILQVVQASAGVWFNHVMTVFIFIVVIEFVKQYERLIVAVSSLKLRTSKFTSRRRNANGVEIESYEQLMRDNIVHCIRHHQMLHRCFCNFRIWFSAFFSFELIICIMMFAFSSYVLINASSASKILNYFVVVSFIWSNLLVRCFISEIFASLNDRLAQTLFYDMEIDWYDTSRTNRQLLLIFHQLSCRSLRLFGLSIFEATRTTFAKLIRITYSIFNVLNTSVRK